MQQQLLQLLQQLLLQPQAGSQPHAGAALQPAAGAAAAQAGSHVLHVLQQLLQQQDLWQHENKPFKPQNRSQPQLLWQQLSQHVLQPQPLLQPQVLLQPQALLQPQSHAAWQPQLLQPQLLLHDEQQVFSQHEGSQQQLEPPPYSIRSSNSNP
ncbi:MAG: hypothetical protein IT427_10060 [Pirellulales bacterium]|nr:hypothetical protein [Pirellulales bacterium]